MDSLEPTFNSSPDFKALLFGAEETQVFTVLDGAAAPKLVERLYEFEPEYCCLHRGELAPDQAVVAPYLVHLEPDTPFAEFVLTEGWGKHWGLFLHTAAGQRALRDHFRKFLSVELPDQRTVQFRFYDPRVLPTFLTACNPMELESFFGPVQCFIVEGHTAETAFRFTFPANKLKSESKKLKTQA